MKPELKPWLQSSADPEQVSNAVKGAIVAASSVIILGATLLFHITLTPENVVALGSDMGMLVGAIWFMYGLLHKGVMYFGSVVR